MRNPFKLLTDEHIESELGFLKLFSPNVLESLEEKYKADALWNKPLMIHSSPGGGKSTLLRIFEPHTLLSIVNSTSSDLREIYKILKRIKAIDIHDKPILGVRLPCTKNYQIFEEYEFSIAQKQRLFFALLNSRIILATLKSLCKIQRVSFPEDLKQVKIVLKAENDFYDLINRPKVAFELYTWASKIEKQIYSFVNSFLPPKMEDIEGHDELFSMYLLKSISFEYENEQHYSGLLFMFDDAHKLSVNQRKSFKEYIIEKRGFVSVWISERLESLDPKTNLGSFEIRDFEKINLEAFWRRNPSKFEKTLENIAFKRARMSTDNVASFEEYLSDNLDDDKIKSALLNYIERLGKEFDNLSSSNHLFSDWCEMGKNAVLPLYEKAILMGKIHIMINRSFKRKQMSLPFPYSVEEINSSTNEVKSASELFLSVKTKTSYYFGFKKLVKLSSFNIEQFLELSAELFEAILANNIKSNDFNISAKTQDSIIRKDSRNRWKRLPSEIPFSDQILHFIENLGDYCGKQTFKDNAPYAPGVNGFCVRKGNKRLFDSKLSWVDDSKYSKIHDIISTCVAFNLFEIQKVNQGKKGQINTIYYLNRWLCVKFSLPLNYGNWRHIKLENLYKWVK